MPIVDGSLSTPVPLIYSPEPSRVEDNIFARSSKLHWNLPSMFPPTANTLRQRVLSKFCLVLCEDPARDLLVSPCGRWAITILYDQPPLGWDLRGRRKLRALDYLKSAQDIRFTPKGNLFYTIGNERIFRLSGTGEETVIDCPVRGPLIWFPDESRFAILDAHEAFVFSFPSGQLVQSRDFGKLELMTGSVSPDGTALAFGFLEASHAEVWDLETDSISDRLESRDALSSGRLVPREKYGEIEYVAFGPVPYLLATGGAGSATLWDLRMRNQFGGWVRARHEVSGIFGGNCADLHFSSDGRWFAASDDCGTIALIGLRDTADSFESRQVAVIRGLHTSGTVYPIAFGFGENDATVIVNGDEVYLFDLDAELLDSLELTISLPRD